MPPSFKHPKFIKEQAPFCFTKVCKTLVTVAFDVASRLTPDELHFSYSCYLVPGKLPSGKRSPGKLTPLKITTLGKLRLENCPLRKTAHGVITP